MIITILLLWIKSKKGTEILKHSEARSTSAIPNVS